MRRAWAGDASTADGREDGSMTINPKHLDWLEGRAIDPETASHFGIYSVRRGSDGALTPDEAGDVLAFPYFRDGREVNTKYRGPGKKFWQRKDARKGFFNADILKDPAVISGKWPLVITEGEIDCLSVIQAGYPFVVSVPDG